MKIETILVLISVILLLAASNPRKDKIRSIHMDQWPDTLSYQYDKEGRV